MLNGDILCLNKEFILQLEMIANYVTVKQEINYANVLSLGHLLCNVKGFVHEGPLSDVSIWISVDR